MRKFIILFLLLIPISLSGRVIVDSPKKLKKFPFIRYGSVWTGTPAELKDVAVPNVIITYGEKEDVNVVASASLIAFYLGQFSDDIGISPNLTLKNLYPKLILPLEKAIKNNKNLIIVGKNNRIVKSLNLKFKAPTVKVLKLRKKAVIITGGKNSEEIIEAIKFLANRIISFKVGAYRTFFSFVKLRGLIKNRNFNCALQLIEEPYGISACGRNMSIAAKMVKKFPSKIIKIIKKRNKILYIDLKKSLKKKNQIKSEKLWYQAMETCYKCHQELKLRKFKPNKFIHSKHQRIARNYGIKKCSYCHFWKTNIRGY